MDETKQKEEISKPNNRKRKMAAGIVFAAVAIIGLIAVYFYIAYKNTHISTDDAYIEGHIHSVAPRIPGTVKKVFVEDNQLVKEGDPLVELDETDYVVRVQEARSALEAEKARQGESMSKIEVARKQLSELQYRVKSARAEVDVRKAKLSLAEVDLKRFEALYKKEAVSKEKYQQTKTDYDVKASLVNASVEELKQAMAALETQMAVIQREISSLKSASSQVGQREAALKQAELDLSYTKITAPVEGHVTKKNVEVGNRVQPAQPLMSVVPLTDDAVYVTANYKETDLKKIKSGDKVDISVDTYSGKTFHGTVESIMAGTGAAFSLFPPENATGNYVKVVQRIPVRIILDKEEHPEQVLRIGMSVVTTVNVK
jgi:membrane fusion protein (multidrug efflux system)